MAKIIGIKEITTKAGKKGWEYHMADKFSEYDLEHSNCSGSQVISEYSSTQFPVKVGDDVSLVYGKGYQGKAQLVDIQLATDNRLKINK